MVGIEIKMSQEQTPTNPDTNPRPSEISAGDWTNTPGSMHNVVRLLPEISAEDRARTPVSVQGVIRTLLKEKLEWQVASKSYTPIWPTPFMLLANTVIIVGL